MAIIRVPKDYKTIQEGVDNAQPGDVVLVSKGTYHENVIVRTNSIRIVSKNKHEALLTGKGMLTSGFFLDDVSDVEVYGFKIQEYTSAGIEIFNASSSGFHRLIENIIQNNREDGIFIRESNSNFIWGNKLQNNEANGIQILGSSNRVVDNEIIENQEKGVFIIIAPDNLSNVIVNNKVLRNGLEGISTAGADTLIYGNQIEKNYEGVNIFTGAVSIIAKNQIRNNTFAGISIGQSPNRNIAISNEVQDNNGEGIKIDSDRNIIQSNNVKDNERKEILVRGDENTIINNDTDKVVDQGTDNNLINNDD